MGDDLLGAAYAGSLTRVKALVADGVDLGLIDSDGNTAVLIAAGRGKCLMVTWLLQYGGANFTETTNAGQNIWDLLMRFKF
jgi:ankyrin repeat protein